MWFKNRLLLDFVYGTFFYFHGYGIKKINPQRFLFILRKLDNLVN